MSSLSLLIAVAFTSSFVAATKIGGNGDISFDLELIKHQPCPFQPGTSRWQRKMEFESGSGERGPQLRAVPSRPNCYTIGGKVTIYDDIKGDLSVYIELKNTANRNKLPERCANQGADGCNGVGSCLYCNACETFEKQLGAQAQLLHNGHPVRCGQTLRKGTYDNLELRFCMPKLDEVIKSQGLTKQTFLSLLQSEDGKNLRSMGMFATVYVFNTDVSSQMKTQMRVEQVYRQSKRMFFKDEPLPEDVYWSLPFNKMIQDKRLFIACHKIYGNLKIDYNN